MKTFKLQLKTEVKTEREISLPAFFKDGGSHFCICSPTKAIRVFEIFPCISECCPSIWITQESEPIAREEFMRAYNKVKEIIESELVNQDLPLTPHFAETNDNEKVGTIND